MSRAQTKRRLGFLGLLAHWPVKLIAVGLTISLLAGTAGDAVLGIPGSGTGNPQAPQTPVQQWGSAAGDLDHLDGRPNNRTLPTSLRGRYPQQVWDQNLNTASVETPPPAEVRGFDQATSKELPESRGAHDRTYANTDGTETTEFSTDPINYRTESGTWSPIETALVAIENGTGWHNTADAVDVRLAPTADAPELATLAVDADHAVSYSLAGAAPAAARIDGSTATYPGVQPHVDLRLESRPGGAKETLVLTAPEAATRYLFPLKLKGLTATIANGQVVFSDASGAQRAVIPAGDMVDAHQARSTGVTYRLITTGAQPALEVTLDTAWLRDPARAYPILVDPTVQLPVTGEAADSAMYVQGDSSASGSSQLRVGTIDGANSASYLKFGGLVSKLQNHTIFGAQLWAVNYDADSCTPREVSVHPVTGAWTAGTGYSYPGPAVGGALASKSFAHGYIAFGQSSSACPTAGELFNLGGGGRDLVQRWVNGEQANNGLSLRGSSDSLSGKRFTGPGTANPPKLFVTHSPYNATYAMPNPVPNPPVLQNQDGKVKITVTNKSAAAWAPGDYYLAYRAFDAKTGAAVVQQRSVNLTTTVARNARVTLDATIKALPPGKYFFDFTMVKSGGPVFTDHQVPPARLVLQVFDIPPVVQELFPPNGYQASTLTPMLWARALDIDAPPKSSLQFKFEICERDPADKPVKCVNSGYQAKTAWTFPAGTLSWSKAYLWRAFVQDATTEIISPYSTLLTTVPQPEITSHVAGSPYSTANREFDPQAGNYTTAAIDASVTTAGPGLSLVRTYNSLDPRRDGLFGAGWTTQYDMKLVQDDDGSGNVVLTYPDGQAVRFGKNADGTYAAPWGRTASLTVDGTAWKLLDQTGTTYQFSLSGRLNKITDSASRSVVLTYNTADGKLAKAQVSNSQTNTAGRALSFVWSGAHVKSVSTDAVNGAPLTWNYTYSGDLLTTVCGPTVACTNYEHTPGSHYRTTVLDSRPDSYWQLGEPDGTGAGSEVAINLGKDAGLYKSVTLGTPGPIVGSTGTAATFNGTTSAVELPKGTVKKSRDAAVELWFKSSLTGSGGPLIGYQDKALGTASATGVPVLYVGTDGKVRGQFATGAVTPITSAAAVNDGKWHHVVLSSMGTSQTLYLDGAKAGELTGKTIDHSLLTFNQVGAAYASTPASWPGWGSTAQRSYAGTIDEVAIYSHPLGQASVTAHLRSGLAQSDSLSKVTLPSGKVASSAVYDVAADRVKEYTDANGGTWKIGPPAVYGDSTDLRRSVEVLDPANRPSLYEYDALGGWVLRLGVPLGMETRPDDKPGEPAVPPAPPVESCTKPDLNDPAFCTTIPNSSGGPVFVRYGSEGMSIRTFFYDDLGSLTSVTDENGDSVSMTYDARGNVTSSKTCRGPNDCQTSYTTYPATATNLYDPRNSLPIETRDGRSASATDNTYRTSYAYHASGQPASQTAPDGGVIQNTFTNGSEAAIGGGSPPAALPATTTDERDKVTRFTYYANGDLAKITEPSGLVTEITYDAIGRKTSSKDITTAYPAGLVTTYTYDGMSRLLTQTDPATANAVTGAKHQLRTTSTYDPDGNLTALGVADALANDPVRVTSYRYDEHNQLVRLTDAGGNETSYGYDAFGNRTSETDANGNRYDFAYTARNSLAEVRLRDWRSDPAGAPATGTGDYLVLHSYSYDFAGRMTSDTDAMGRRLEYSYYGDGQVRRKTLKNFRNPDGTKRDFVVEDNTYDGAGNLSRQITGNGKAVTQYTTDKAGRVASVTADPGGLARSTTYSFDQGGNVLRATTAGKPSNVPWIVSTTPAVVDYTYDDAGNRTLETVTDGTAKQSTKYGYDQRGLLISTTDPRGNAAGADPAAFTTKYGYDEAGRQVSTTGAPVSAESTGQPARTVTPVQIFGYNTYDEPTEVKDELGKVSTSAFDLTGRLVSATAPAYQAPGQPAAVTATITAKYDGNGNAVEITSPRSGVTRVTYDQLSRMVSLDEPASTDLERAVWKYTYARAGGSLSVTDPAGGRTEATYDDLDRQVSSTQVERRPTAGVFTTKFAYDDMGNVTSAAAPSGANTVNVYDAVGELTKSTDPAGVPTQLGYDYAGRQVRATDGLGRTNQVAYDLFGRQVAESDLKPDGTTLRTSKFGYDLAGNLLTATDPLQATTTFAYDAASRMVKQVEPVSGTKTITTTFGYDEAGNRTRLTDGRNNSSITTYNSLGLPESTIEPATAAQPNAADRTWTAAYDRNGNAVSLTAPGGVVRTRTFDAADRLTGETGTGAEAATAARTLGYDLLGRTTAVNGATGTNAYTYDDRGNLLTTTGPGGTAGFAYNSDGNPTTRTDSAGTAGFGYTSGRLTSMTDGITGAAQQISYDGAGALKTVGYGAGRTRTFGYDDLGRRTSDTLVNSAAKPVSSSVYAFDLNDKMAGETTTGTAGAGAQSYDYDQAGRLTGLTAGGVFTEYAWDDSGNRVKAGAKASAYDERNRLLSDGDYTYAYSPRGNLKTRTSSGLTEQFSFDAFERLVTAAGQNYTYDGLDRVAARNGTAFTYAGLDDGVVADGAGTYGRGASGELLATAKGGTERLSLSDGHGDVVGGFDPADTGLAQLPDSTAYDPFGKVTAKSGSTGSLGYQGDWTDPATGQVDMGARWYDPGTGAFNAKDDVDYSGGDSVLANRYTYGAGDPMGSVDPDGHYPTPSGNLVTCDPSFMNFVCLQYQSQFTYYAIMDQVRAQQRAAGKKSNSQKPRTSYPSYAPGPASSGRGSGGGCGACYDPAAAAREAARQKYLKAKATSDAARAGNAANARNVPRGVSSAAKKPVVSSSDVASSSPSLPAQSTGSNGNVVADQKKATDKIYQKAVEAVGPVVQNTSKASGAPSESTSAGGLGGGSGGDFSFGDLFKKKTWQDADFSELGDPGMWWEGAKGAADVIGEVTGINDALDCVTELDLEACAWTAVTVASMLTGPGGVAAVRAARAGRVAAKYGDDVVDAVRQSSKVLDDVSCAVTAVAKNSFTADTEVRMGDGTAKPISEVKTGDQVLATDPTTGRTGAQAVTAVIVGDGVKNLVAVTVATGEITATSEHPFWLADERRWANAGELRAGQRIQTADGQGAVVTATRAWTEQERVYNLTVDALHTFYVVAGGVDLLVHNTEVNSNCPVHGSTAVPGTDPAKCTCRHSANEDSTQSESVVKQQQEQRETQAKATVGTAPNIAKGLGHPAGSPTDAWSAIALAVSVVGIKATQAGQKIARWWKARGSR
ncbi:polymorphic toxin-type HINT domain-containing protein [Amycolatopsis sp.]|uniref:polymorphic toxin-type HINT domain-containing protein n=1 Tax=Amycolatopsis sp. TaxID=37632 RepID=UPI002E09924F|nr:polymorphic toxin-type HINT domain-containing protein [Amycolatopsis sp.]